MKIDFFREILNLDLETGSDHITRIRIRNPGSNGSLILLKVAVYQWQMDLFMVTIYPINIQILLLSTLILRVKGKRKKVIF